VTYAIPDGAAPGTMDAMTEQSEILDEALEVLCDTGPEFGPGLSNHGPMAAEALFTLDRGESVLPWVEKYKSGLIDAPEATNPISRSDWREFLGDRSGLGRSSNLRNTRYFPQIR